MKESSPTASGRVLARIAGVSVILVTAVFALILVTPTAAHAAWLSSYEVAGDFNGDGSDDIVHFVTNGVYAEMWRFSSDTSRFSLQRIWQSGAGAWAWTSSRAAAGDVDADGKDEVCVLYDLGSSTTALYVFDVDPGGVTLREAWRSAAGAFNWSYAAPIVGNYDSDPAEEMLVFYRDGTGMSSWRRFDFSGGSATASTIWSTASWEWNNSKVVSTDVDNDGLEEPVIFYDYGTSTTGMWVFQVNGTSVGGSKLWQSSAGWVWSSIKTAEGDVDDDGLGEPLVMFDYGLNTTGLWVFNIDGTTVTPLKKYQSGAGDFAWSAAKPLGADVDCDGQDEVLILYNYSAESWALFLLRNDTGWTIRTLWGSGGAWPTAATTTSYFTNPSTALQLTVPAAAAYGSAQLVGLLRTVSGGPVRSRNVVIQSSPDNSSWANLGTVVTGASGDYSLTVSVAAPTYYRAVFAGDSAYNAATSSSGISVPYTPAPPAPIAAPAPTLPKLSYLSYPSCLSRVRYGSSFRSWGYMKPRHTTGAKSVRILAYRREGGVWRLRKTLYPANYYYSSTQTKYQCYVRLPYRGLWRMRAYAPPDSRHSATYSAYTRSFTVY